MSENDAGNGNGNTLEEGDEQSPVRKEVFAMEKGPVPVVVLTADDLLNATLRTIEIDVPALGGNVLARELMGSQRDDYERLCSQGKRKGDDYRSLRARLIIMSLVDGEGSLLLNIKQLGAVNRMPAKILDDVFDQLLEFNGMSIDAEEKAEADLEETPTS